MAETPEIERLFDTILLKRDAANALLEQARDLLILRNLQALGQDSSLRETNLKLEARTVALRDERRGDRLTGLYNRGYLDLMLRRELQAAVSGNWSLSLVFVDLDDFKALPPRSADASQIGRCGVSREDVRAAASGPGSRVHWN